jgi:hypothetical protein
VLVTVFHAGPHRLRRALCAHKLLWLEFLKHILGFNNTVNHAAKIRDLALVAVVLSQFEQRELAQFVEVWVLRVGKPWMLMQFFKLCALGCFLFDRFLYLYGLIEKD